MSVMSAKQGQGQVLPDLDVCSSVDAFDPILLMQWLGHKIEVDVPSLGCSSGNMCKAFVQHLTLLTVKATAITTSAQHESLPTLLNLACLYYPPFKNNGETR